MNAYRMEDTRICREILERAEGRKSLGRDVSAVQAAISRVKAEQSVSASATSSQQSTKPTKKS